MSIYDYLDAFGLPANSNDLSDMPRIHSGQCCNCVYDDGDNRVWICRVDDGVTVETLNDGRWEVVAGSCEHVL